MPLIHYPLRPGTIDRLVSKKSHVNGPKTYVYRQSRFLVCACMSAPSKRHCVLTIHVCYGAIHASDDDDDPNAKEN